MTALAPSPGATEVRTELTITGMTCGNCVHHVEEALAAIPGTRSTVYLDTASAVVVHPRSVPVQDVVDAVADAGYEACPR